MCNGVNIRKKIEIPKFDDSIFDYFIKPDINLVFKPKPIELTINSTGGSVYDAFFAIDAIKNLKIDVHTIASGYCASAATLLSLSGKKRFITKNTNMLIHEIRSGFWGKKTSINDEYENLNKLSEQLIQYYKQNTKMESDKLQEILKRDCNWTPDECILAGLVDEII